MTIAWTTNRRKLEMRWSEFGGPRVKGPIRRGFGTKLIEASARGVGGNARMSVEADGVRWHVTVPLSTEVVHGKVSPSLASSVDQIGGGFYEVASQKLEGARILVVEDEPLLAMDIAGQLEDAGAQVIGPAGNASAALSLIEQYRFDAALLDANLGGHPVDEIAASLARKNIPFAFVSGYGRESLPRTFDDARLLSKPFDPDHLIEVTAKLVAEQSGDRVGMRAAH
ncbi:MAG TPA: response regulator [Novosphingobium sp.]